MSRTKKFQELRPLLFSIAYRILGSVSEAEDAVQETWLRFEAAPTELRTVKAFLSATVTSDLDRRVALGPCPAGGVRRAVVA
ncbi:sigma factor [Nonomuraea dietziae]|uniref:DNA-directed RNA polymerase specialized sigma24 family protein n=1 Tax=Nonomuraea dietziae TaxID=65515 RepID=A0A7W5VBF9_9ACTN|nr:sigma factor [Nonomuraea dietziae]MBB3724547.1 DNA-directed RNA polymerase specialized sigma24 family protein [Nonomuraea dietziae]